MLGPASSCVTPPFAATVAYEAVPNKDPVIPFDKINVFKLASDPDVMTFFQLGIFYLVMVGYNKGVLPTSRKGQ